MCAAEQLPEVEAQTEEADEGAFQQTFRWSVEVTAPERIAALVGGQMEDYRVPIRYLPPGKLVDLWYQFLSWVETQRKQGAAAEGEAAIPSWATFYRCWTEFSTSAASAFVRRASMRNVMTASGSASSWAKVAYQLLTECRLPAGGVLT